jgi:hypothetical protein
MGDFGDDSSGAPLAMQGERYAFQHVRAGVALAAFDPGEPGGGYADELGERCQPESACLALAPDPFSPRLHAARLGKFW